MKDSIATKLLKVSFSFYFVLTLTVTLIHMFSEYYYTKHKVIEEISIIYETYEPGLSSAIWDFNYVQLNQMALGIIKLPIVDGIQIEFNSSESISFGIIHNQKGETVSIDKNGNENPINKNNKLLKFTFDIQRIDKENKLTLGKSHFFCSQSVIFQRVKLGFLFLIINAFIKTLALWIIFLFIARHILIRPLSILTESAAQLNFNNLEKIHINLNTTDNNELKTLEKVFNTMIEKLLHSRREIQNYTSELKKKNYDLKEMDRIKDAILANTSHELRTPLNGIIGIADSLIDGSIGQLTSEQKHNLSLISHSGRRLSRLVNNILDFSKLQKKEFKLHKQSIHLQSITEVVMMLSKPLIGNKKISLLNQISQDIKVYADENCLQQIFHNLIGNAIKFTETGTISVLSEEDQEKNIIITISDTGIGVSKEKFESIFRSFEQADGSIIRKYGGTGLGLPITKYLVKLHGGKIWIESELGKGTKFHFTLQKSEGHKETITLSDILKKDTSIPNISNVSQEITSHEFKTHSNFIADDHTTKLAHMELRQHILIVDDEPINIQVLMNQLSYKDYILTPVVNVHKAIEIIESNIQIDLVLLDIMMPEMSGYEVCQIIRKKFNENELPVIMLTAKNQINDLVEGFKVGANDYITKPFNQEELQARVSSHLRLKRLISDNTVMKTKLDIVRQFQEMILPSEKELKQIKTLDISIFMEPAENVSGDYFDIIQINDIVKFGIGDVSGHGLKSGVLMLMAQSAIRTMVTHGVDDPALFLNVINRVIFDNIQRIKANKSLSLSIMDYMYDSDSKNGILKISGQHEDVIVVRKNGHIELVDTCDLGFPIGLEKNISKFVAESSISLQTGDGVVLFTDGITEAINLANEMYGMKRFCNVIGKYWESSVENIKKAIIDDIRLFISKQKILDDFMLIIIKQK